MSHQPYLIFHGKLLSDRKSLSKLKSYILGSFSHEVLTRHVCLTEPLLSTGVCTELFQFDTSPAPTSPDEGVNAEAKDIAASVASKAAQGSHHNLTSKVSLPVAPRSRRDPFAVPLPPVRPKSSSSMGEKGNNGTDPGVEDIVKDHMKGRHSQDAPSTMVVSVLAGPEEYGKKGGRKGMSQVFVVVLVNSQKYVTYSCILPHGDRPHVVAD